MKKSNFSRAILDNKAVFIAIIMAVVIGIIQPIFFSPRNLLNLLRQVCSSTIIAMGFTFVLALAEIDLSVGAIVGLNGVLMAKLMVEAGLHPLIAILITLAASVGMGFVNAFIVSALNIPPFIVTLATQSIFRGLVYIITNMVPISGLPDSFINIGQGYAGVIPIPVIIMVIIIVFSYILGNYTTFGRHVIAMGGNVKAAQACGVNIKKVRVGVYVLTAVCSTIASVIMTARAASAQVAAGEGAELDVIAAVVIGGTSMAGGNMNIIGSVFGCLIIGMITNGMNLMGVNSNYQIIAKGVLILLALVVDRVSSNIYDRMLHDKSMKTAKAA